MKDLLSAHKIMMKRYKAVIASHALDDKEFLMKFCDTAQTLTNPDKLSRWVGYIQGILCDRKILDLDFERDISRGIYKPIYESLGYDTSTVDVE